MKNDVWVDFKHPILNEWCPGSYWRGRENKETGWSMALRMGRPPANQGTLKKKKLFI